MALCIMSGEPHNGSFRACVLGVVAVGTLHLTPRKRATCLPGRSLLALALEVVCILIFFVAYLRGDAACHGISALGYL